IRKVTAQRAENNQKNYKKDNFYIISIEIVFFHLSRYFMSRTLSIRLNGILGIGKSTYLVY
ncbi:hypothetical protein NAG80_07440, partial [Staphylococcus hominis]|uniref:hypothetical protein n=1 Tax=Staphylococcus hominis TaxID=1290 RepID=UPI002094905B